MPPGLSTRAKAIWRKLKAEYLIEDPGGLVLLATAMQAFTRAERAQTLIDAEGECVRDRFGQLRPHPACAVERDARSSLLQAMRALHLDMSKVVHHDD